MDGIDESLLLPLQFLEDASPGGVFANGDNGNVIGNPMALGNGTPYREIEAPFSEKCRIIIHTADGLYIFTPGAVLASSMRSASSKPTAAHLLAQ